MTEDEYAGKEFPVNRIFVDINNNLVKVIKDLECSECVFFTEGPRCKPHPACTPDKRLDSKVVSFKKIGVFKEYINQYFPINSEFYSEDGILLRVIPQDTCDGCYFECGCYSLVSALRTNHCLCGHTTRKDKTAVIFKEVINDK